MNTSKRNAAFVILTLPALAFAAAVQAEEGVHGSVTAGVASAQIDNPSSQFGRFTGVTDDKTYLLGGADIQSRNGARYWDFRANDLGLDNRRLTLDGGNTGSYKFNFRYEEQPNLLSNNSRTPFDGAGGNNLTLPSTFVKNTTTTGMTALASSLKGVDLGTQRKEGEAGLLYELNKNLDLSFSFKRQLKEGVKSIGMDVATGGNVRGVVLPEPVDHQTDEFRTGLSWHNERARAKVEYFLSLFSNNHSSLSWESPYTGAGYPTTGRAALAPDNQAQRLSLSGSYNLAPATRLSALYEWGSMTQDSSLLPYTTTAVATTALPRGAADAQIDTTLLKLELASQPLPKLSLNARYRYYETENKTPRDLYRPVIADTNGQVAATASQAGYNKPYDYTQNQFVVDGAYYFGWGTNLKLGYDHDEKDYRFRAVKATKEDTFSGRLNKRWDAGATLNVDLAQGKKRSDGGYSETRAFEASHTTGYLATLASNVYFDNLPAMRQFDIADRDRWKQGVGLTLLPHQNLTVGLNVNRLKDEFNASQFGLQEQENKIYMLDATLTPEPVSSVTFYYTRQDIDSRQTSRSYNGSPAATKAAQSILSTRDWTARTQDAVDTLGVAANRKFMEDRLLVRLGYSYSRTNTDTSFTAGSALTAPINLPAVKSWRKTLDLSATYSVKKELGVQVGALWEQYRSDDWATDGMEPGTTQAGTQLLTLTGSPADYRAFVLRTSVNYRF